MNAGPGKAQKSKAFAVRLALFAIPAVANAQFNFTTNSGGGSVTLALYSGTGGAVTIPSTFNGLPVTAIGSNAFASAYNTLTSVTIPNSVTNIGSNAFSGCYVMTNVMLPSSLAILGSEAFAGCALSRAILPGGSTMTRGNASEAKSRQIDFAGGVCRAPEHNGYGNGQKPF